MTRRILFVTLLGFGLAPALRGQAWNVVRRHDATSHDTMRFDLTEQRASFQETLVHNGKWVTAAGVLAFTFAAAAEHRRSRRDWDNLLAICRSAQDACELGPDGRYLRADAEALYLRSRAYDRRANRWLVGAQASLIATTALFIIDLKPGDGPENIPFPAQIRVGGVGGGAGVEMRLAF